MLIVNALVNKLTEVCGPYLLKKYKKRLFERKIVDEIEKQSITLDQYEVKFWYEFQKKCFQS